MALAKRHSRYRLRKVARTKRVKLGKINPADHQKLVHSIVNKRLGSMGKGAKHSMAEDMRGEGMLALVQAAKNFKPKGKASFSTFATKHIHHALGRHLKRQGLVHPGEKTVRRMLQSGIAGKDIFPRVAMNAVNEGSTERDLEIADARLRFRSLTKGLKPRELSVLRASAIYSNAEISKRLKIPKTTVHKILTRTKMRLRRKEAA